MRNQMLTNQSCETEIQILLLTENVLFQTHFVRRIETIQTSFRADYIVKEQLTFADRTAEPFHTQTAVGSHDFHTCTSIETLVQEAKILHWKITITKY